nr:MAG TPA: TM helix protein [Caudoviricetes sp.]
MTPRQEDNVSGQYRRWCSFLCSPRKKQVLLWKIEYVRGGDWFVMGIIGSVLIAVGAFLIAKWIKD